jgi:hypothetical protein
MKCTLYGGRGYEGVGAKYLDTIYVLILTGNQHKCLGLKHADNCRRFFSVYSICLLCSIAERLAIAMTILLTVTSNFSSERRYVNVAEDFVKAMNFGEDLIF